MPFDDHADWEAPAGRDPIALLEQQATERDPSLIGIRHHRMSMSPFAYYRGAALSMAVDLTSTPTTGITPQICGDAHLSNFGLFASPERHLVFDLNDFDETAPGPWEWDVKRLAASIEIAGRANAYDHSDRRAIVRASTASYRESMAAFAAMSQLDVWYQRLDMDELVPGFADALDPKTTPAIWKAVDRARAHDHHQAFAKLAIMVDGRPRIAADPPLIVPVEDLVSEVPADVVRAFLQHAVEGYLASLSPERRLLLRHYDLVDFARKVVGVGSVGTQAWIALLVDRGQGDPLFLQVKEAQTSVIETATGTTVDGHHGERVVNGQQAMQAASDIFLGWCGAESMGRDVYVRQLRDWKGSAEVERMTTKGMTLFGRMCGWTLARAHARTGDRHAIADYLGETHAFDKAVASFASVYADQTELDHQALLAAIASGRLQATEG